LISFEVGGGLLRHADEADSVATLAFLPPRRARMILGAPKLAHDAPDLAQLRAVESRGR